jgi:hypothetical protein
VSLESHAHQTPQVGFPHNDPVVIEIIEKINPTGAKLFAIKEANLILKIKFKIEAIPIKLKHPRAINDEGTCTYIILTESPCM